MDLKRKINSNIDWIGCCKVSINKSYFLNEEPQYITVKHDTNTTLEDARIKYFTLLEKFLNEVYSIAENSKDERIINIFHKYNVTGVDLEDPNG